MCPLIGLCVVNSRVELDPSRPYIKLGEGNAATFVILFTGAREERKTLLLPPLLSTFVA